MPWIQCQNIQIGTCFCSYPRVAASFRADMKIIKHKHNLNGNIVVVFLFVVFNFDNPRQNKYIQK